MPWEQVPDWSEAPRMSGSYQRQSLELRSPDHGSVDDPDGCLRNHLGSSASQRRRQQRIAQQRQDSWFRHSMPPAINRDFESLEHLTPRASDGLDEQLAASVSHSVHSGGSVTLCGPPDHSSIHLNSANSNLGFIDSDTPNTPVTPVSGLQPPASVSTSVAGTLSSRRRSSNRKDSKGSILSRQSGKSRVSLLAQRGLRMTASFLRRKRTEYEGECEFGVDDGLPRIPG